MLCLFCDYESFEFTVALLFFSNKISVVSNLREQFHRNIFLEMRKNRCRIERFSEILSSALRRKF